MNQSEARRKQLLTETRNLYSDKYRIPAVHPRYSNAYTELYDKDTSASKTLGVRIIICLLLFFLYLTMEYTNSNMFSISSTQIENSISKNWSEINYEKIFNIN